MRHVSVFLFATCLPIGDVQAAQTWELNGVFCNTESQVREVLEHHRLNMSLNAAVAAANGESVNCVVADRIKYVVSDPIVISTIHQNGLILTMYEADLVGILVGRNTRPIAPALRTFFVLNKRLGGVATLSHT